MTVSTDGESTMCSTKKPKKPKARRAATRKNSILNGQDLKKDVNPEFKLSMSRNASNKTFIERLDIAKVLGSTYRYSNNSTSFINKLRLSGHSAGHTDPKKNTRQLKKRKSCVFRNKAHKLWFPPKRMFASKIISISLDHC